jgi:hypothetical protein
LTRPEACHDRRFDDSDGSDDGDADQVAEGMVGGNNGCTDVQADVCAWCCEPPFDGHGSAQCIQVPGQQRVKSPDKQGVAAPASVWLWEPPRDGRGVFCPRGIWAESVRPQGSCEVLVVAKGRGRSGLLGRRRFRLQRRG